MRDRTVTWLGTLAVVAHQAVAHLHGLAHRSLGINLNLAQMLFVGIVIVVAPILAAILLWTKRARAGAALLAVSMPASLAFGVYHHFLLVSPDHVAHLPAGDQQSLFIMTAYLLPVFEIAAAAIGLWGLTRLRPVAE